MRSKREAILFDANNKEHRALYKKFLDDRSWGKLPVVFETKGFGITLGHIERQLLDYYTSKEFTSR